MASKPSPVQEIVQQIIFLQSFFTPNCEGLPLMSLVRVRNVYPPPKEKGRTRPSICRICLEIQAAHVIIYVSEPIKNLSGKDRESLHISPPPYLLVVRVADWHRRHQQQVCKLA